MSDFIKRLVLLALGLVVGLGAAELLSRAIYTRPWYERLVVEQLRPGRDVGVWKNRLGLRDHDYPPVRPPGCRRVLVLGDSFTYGLGAADNGAVFPELLERRLSDEGAASGRRVEVLNGGLIASLTGKWVEPYGRV